MIQANELRIGNLFAMNDFPMYVEAIFRDTVYLNFEGNEGDVWEEDIKDLVPIPLTEEILLKAGFEKDIESLFYRNNFIIGKTKTRWAFYHNGLMGGELVRIDFLHELQNLFFALTGEEIKIEV